MKPRDKLLKPILDGVIAIAVGSLTIFYLFLNLGLGISLDNLLGPYLFFIGYVYAFVLLNWSMDLQRRLRQGDDVAFTIVLGVHLAVGCAAIFYFGSVLGLFDRREALEYYLIIIVAIPPCMFLSRKVWKKYYAGRHSQRSLS